MQLPTLVGQHIAEQRQRRQSHRQRRAQCFGPLQHRLQPVDHAMLCERGKRRKHSVATPAGDEAAKLIGEPVQRTDRKRVAVQRDERRNRQIHAEQQRQQRSRHDLQRTGDQAADHTRRDTACHRAPVQMPQARIGEPVAKMFEKSIFCHLFMIWQPAADRESPGPRRRPFRPRSLRG